MRQMTPAAINKEAHQRGFFALPVPLFHVTCRELLVPLLTRFQLNNRGTAMVQFL